eukprot:g23691.t1
MRLLADLSHLKKWFQRVHASVRASRARTADLSAKRGWTDRDWCYIEYNPMSRSIQMPPFFDILLREMGRSFLPFLRANRQALASQQKSFTLAMRSGPGGSEQVSFLTRPASDKSVRLTARFVQMRAHGLGAGEERAALASLFQEYGLVDLFWPSARNTSTVCLPRLLPCPPRVERLSPPPPPPSSSSSPFSAPPSAVQTDPESAHQALLASATNRHFSLAELGSPDNNAKDFKIITNTHQLFSHQTETEQQTSLPKQSNLLIRVANRQFSLAELGSPDTPTNNLAPLFTKTLQKSPPASSSQQVTATSKL